MRNYIEDLTGRIETAKKAGKPLEDRLTQNIEAIYKNLDKV